MDWHILNVRKQEASKYDSFDVEFKLSKPKKINRPYEYRKEISRILKTDIGQILGETKGFTEAELNGIIKDVEAYVATFQKDPAPRCRNLLTEVKLKKKNEQQIKKPELKKDAGKTIQTSNPYTKRNSP